jgi:hypothetical protein
MFRVAFARAATKAMRAEAPTLSFSKRDVSSVWPDNIHKVSVLGDHFDWPLEALDL